MDVVLLQSSVYSLPTSQRVGVIVHDGSADMRIWPGPGTDFDFQQAYGPDFAKVAQAERDRLADKQLALGQIVRLHPGRLHCDFLLWAAMRPKEQGGYQGQGSPAELITQVVRESLAFASERHVERIAFSGLGEGHESLPEAERLTLVARAAQEYFDECFAQGKPIAIEEVVVCSTSLSALSGAKKQTAAFAKSAKVEAKAAAAPKAAKAPKEPKAPKAPKSPKSPRSSTRAPKKPYVDPEEVAYAKTHSSPWDRGVRYNIGDWFIHSKFGAGKVTGFTYDGFAQIVFEDGAERLLIHARPAV